MSSASLKLIDPTRDNLDNQRESLVSFLENIEYRDAVIRFIPHYVIIILNEERASEEDFRDIVESFRTEGFQFTTNFYLVDDLERSRLVHEFMPVGDLICFYSGEFDGSIQLDSLSY